MGIKAAVLLFILAMVAGTAMAAGESTTPFAQGEYLTAARPAATQAATAVTAGQKDAGSTEEERPDYAMFVFTVVAAVLAAGGGLVMLGREAARRAKARQAPAPPDPAGGQTAVSHMDNSAPPSTGIH